MRTHPSNILSLCFLLAPFFSTSIAITLSQFQQITGFSAQCTDAYNTPIPGCTASDFYPTNPCSTACINGLVISTNLVKSACAGVSVYPTDLIGLIFSGDAIQKLCPKVDVSTVFISTHSQSTSTPRASSSKLSTAAVATVTTTVAAATTTVTTAASSTSSTTIGTVSTTSEAELTSSTATFITSVSSSVSDSIASTTASIISTTALSTLAIPLVSPTFLKTAVNDGSATVLTSKAEQTASNNPDAFGGGGSPFEISASAHNIVRKSWIWLSILFWFPILWL